MQFRQQQRIFPIGNLTIPISVMDKITYPQVCALGSSSRGGYFSVYNYQDVRTWRDNITLPTPLPWNERSKIPVWRGTAWLGVENEPRKMLDEELASNLKRVHSEKDRKKFGQEFLVKMLNASKFHKRLTLCHFSNQHPELLNAKLAVKDGIPREYWPNNASNGFDSFLPFDKIPVNDYYTKYQVSVIMGGHGAAFRTARILGQGIAVLLQDFPFEEWFVQYMTPFVHYIPLSRDLHDLGPRLQWIVENPSKVHDIAMAGQAFYQKYLSHDAMDEFYYELIFRLMMIHQAWELLAVLCCANITLCSTLAWL